MINKDKGYSLLSELKPGQTARIISYALDNAVSRRLVEMGLSPEKEVYYVRNAPLGDPLQLKINNNILSLRHKQASQIKIELLDE